MRTIAVHHSNIRSKKQKRKINIHQKQRRRINIHRIVRTFLMVFMMTLCVLAFIYAWCPKYEVKYVSYQAQKGDTMYSVVKEFNKHYPNKDIRDLLSYVQQENGLDSAGRIQAGETYQIPVIQKRISFFEYYFGGEDK
jgi:hypothetical protein